jgi:hypothetical protein
MRSFRRSPSYFPADMLRRLDLLGRFEMDHVGSRADASEVYSTCIGPFFQQARADPPGFVTALSSVVRDETGGFATYGASCLVVELLGMDRREPDALALLDRAITFKRERGLPSAALKGYEWNRWLDSHGPGTW